MSEAPAAESSGKRIDWQNAVGTLTAQVTEWSRQAGWAVEQLDAPLTEKHLGTYIVPTLHIHTGTGVLIVEPVARNLVGHGDGRVDLYSLATFRRLLLIREGDGWQLYTEDRVAWPQTWGPAAFIHVARELTTR